eukprot:COSAG04_NODE_412_length_14743_cov_74.925294_8_plen_2183_part_01
MHSLTRPPPDVSSLFSFDIMNKKEGLAVGIEESSLFSFTQALSKPCVGHWKDELLIGDGAKSTCADDMMMVMEERLRKDWGNKTFETALNGLSASASAAWAGTEYLQSLRNGEKAAVKEETAAKEEAAVKEEAPSPENLAMLKDMGFPEDECRRALAAALNDPDRALQYLMEGIPEGAGQMAAQAPASGTAVKEKAAVSIQTMFRGMCARKAVAAVKEEAAAEKAAVTIQSMFRDMCARKAVAAEKAAAEKAAVTIQSMFRDMCAHKAVAAEKAAAEKADAELKAKEKAKADKAAVKIKYKGAIVTDLYAENIETKMNNGKPEAHAFPFEYNASNDIKITDSTKTKDTTKPGKDKTKTAAAAEPKTKPGKVKKEKVGNSRYIGNENEKSRTKSKSSKTRRGRSDRGGHSAPCRPGVSVVSSDEFQKMLAARATSPPIERPTEPPSEQQKGKKVMDMIAGKKLLLVINRKSHTFGGDATIKDLLNAGNGCSAYVNGVYLTQKYGKDMPKFLRMKLCDISELVNEAEVKVPENLRGGAGGPTKDNNAFMDKTASKQSDDEVDEVVDVKAIVKGFLKETPSISNKKLVKAVKAECPGIGTKEIKSVAEEIKAEAKVAAEPEPAAEPEAAAEPEGSVFKTTSGENVKITGNADALAAMSQMQELCHMKELFKEMTDTQFCVKTPVGTLTLPFVTEMPVEVVKMLVCCEMFNQHNFYIPTDQMRLKFGLKQLEDDGTLGSYGVVPDNTLFLLGKLNRGGMERTLGDLLGDLAPEHQAAAAQKMEERDAKANEKGQYTSAQKLGGAATGLKSLVRSEQALVHEQKTILARLEAAAATMSLNQNDLKFLVNIYSDPRIGDTFDQLIKGIKKLHQTNKKRKKNQQAQEEKKSTLLSHHAQYGNKVADQETGNIGQQNNVSDADLSAFLDTDAPLSLGDRVQGGEADCFQAALYDFVKQLTVGISKTLADVSRVQFKDMNKSDKKAAKMNLKLLSEKIAPFIEEVVKPNTEMAKMLDSVPQLQEQVEALRAQLEARPAAAADDTAKVKQMETKLEAKAAELAKRKRLLKESQKQAKELQKQNGILKECEGQVKDLQREKSLLNMNVKLHQNSAEELRGLLEEMLRRPVERGDHNTVAQLALWEDRLSRTYDDDSQTALEQRSKCMLMLYMLALLLCHDVHMPGEWGGSDFENVWLAMRTLYGYYRSDNDFVSYNGTIMTLKDEMFKCIYSLLADAASESPGKWGLQAETVGELITFARKQNKFSNDTPWLRGEENEFTTRSHITEADLQDKLLRSKLADVEKELADVKKKVKGDTEAQQMVENFMSRETDAKFEAMNQRDAAQSMLKGVINDPTDAMRNFVKLLYSKTMIEIVEYLLDPAYDILTDDLVTTGDGSLNGSFRDWDGELHEAVGNALGQMSMENLQALVWYFGATNLHEEVLANEGEFDPSGVADGVETSLLFYKLFEDATEALEPGENGLLSTFLCYFVHNRDFDGTEWHSGARVPGNGNSVHLFWEWLNTNVPQAAGRFQPFFSLEQQTEIIMFFVDEGATQPCLASHPVADIVKSMSTMFNKVKFRVEVPCDVGKILAALRTSGIDYCILGRETGSYTIGGVTVPLPDQEVLMNVSAGWRNVREVIDEQCVDCHVASGSLLPSEHYDGERRDLEEAVRFVSLSTIVITTKHEGSNVQFFKNGNGCGLYPLEADSSAVLEDLSIAIFDGCDGYLRFNNDDGTGWHMLDDEGSLQDRGIGNSTQWEVCSRGEGGSVLYNKAVELVGELADVTHRVYNGPNNDDEIETISLHIKEVTDNVKDGTPNSVRPRDKEWVQMLHGVDADGNDVKLNIDDVTELHPCDSLKTFELFEQAKLRPSKQDEDEVIEDLDSSTVTRDNNNITFLPNHCQDNDVWLLVEELLKTDSHTLLKQFMKDLTDQMLQSIVAKYAGKHEKMHPGRIMLFLQDATSIRGQRVAHFTSTDSINMHGLTFDTRWLYLSLREAASHEELNKILAMLGIVGIKSKDKLTKLKAIIKWKPLEISLTLPDGNTVLINTNMFTSQVFDLVGEDHGIEYRLCKGDSWQPLPDPAGEDLSLRSLGIKANTSFRFPGRVLGGGVGKEQVEGFVGKLVSISMTNGKDYTGTLTKVTDKLALVTTVDGSVVRPKLSKMSEMHLHEEAVEVAEDDGAGTGLTVEEDEADLKGK